MKNSTFRLLTAVLFNTMVAILFSAVLAIDPVIPIVVLNLISLRFSKPEAVSGMAFSGVNKEIWTADIIEDFYATAKWLTKGRDMSSLVENNTINLAVAGVLPEVYVNNTTYPILAVSRTDTPVALPLDTLDTQNTVVRNVEAMEAAYDKRQSVWLGHQTALRLKTYQRASHAYSPNSNTTNTPVLVATGGDDGTGRKRLTLSDVAKAQRLVEEIDGIDAEIAKQLVLCPKHKEDLILEDKALFKVFANLKKGEVLDLFNFEISVYNNPVIYNTSTGAKKALGAVAAPSTDSKATSFFFTDSEVMYADGDYDMFVTYKDPAARGDIVGFQKRFLALPLRNKGLGAIYSGAAS